MMADVVMMKEEAIIYTVKVLAVHICPI
jgi:hypothetical protein